VKSAGKFAGKNSRRREFFPAKVPAIFPATFPAAHAVQ
jgi:hypothetical protein